MGCRVVLLIIWS